MKEKWNTTTCINEINTKLDIFCHWTSKIDLLEYWIVITASIRDNEISFPSLAELRSDWREKLWCFTTVFKAAT